jgi:hypothetical protein
VTEQQVIVALRNGRYAEGKHAGKILLLFVIFTLVLVYPFFLHFFPWTSAPFYVILLTSPYEFILFYLYPF